jgi:hypothetical protein
MLALSVMFNVWDWQGLLPQCPLGVLRGEMDRQLLLKREHPFEANKSEVRSDLEEALHEKTCAKGERLAGPPASILEKIVLLISMSRSTQS